MSNAKESKNFDQAMVRDDTRPFQSLQTLSTFARIILAQQIAAGDHPR
jgi:hypothetical protein